MYIRKLIAVLFISLFFVLPCYARFSVNPSKFEGAIPPGGAYENIYIISNSRSTPVTIEVKWVDKTINPLTDDWLVLFEKEVTVEGNKSVRVPFKITIPENAQGEYNARVYFSQKTDPDLPNAIGIRYNNPIYVAVKGTEQYDFEIEKINISNNKYTLIDVLMKNTGNVHIRPKGTIDIMPVDDNTSDSYSFSFNENKWAIIPEESYIYSHGRFKTKLNLPDGKYRLAISIFAGKGEKIKKWSKEMSFVIDGHSAKIIDDNFNNK